MVGASVQHAALNEFVRHPWPVKVQPIMCAWLNSLSFSHHTAQYGCGLEGCCSQRDVIDSVSGISLRPP